MDELNRLLSDLYEVFESNFFLSREFNKLFTCQENASKLVQEQKFQEITKKLLEFILSIHKKKEQSTLSQRIAQTQKLLSNYQAQIASTQKQEELPVMNQHLDALIPANYKSNPISPRDGLLIGSKNVQHGNEKRQKSNQSYTNLQQKGMRANSSQQRFFIENIPKMGKSQVKEDQQRQYNIITGV